MFAFLNNFKEINSKKIIKNIKADRQIWVFYASPLGTFVLPLGMPPFSKRHVIDFKLFIIIFDDDTLLFDARCTNNNLLNNPENYCLPGD